MEDGVWARDLRPTPGGEGGCRLAFASFLYFPCHFTGTKISPTEAPARDA